MKKLSLLLTIYFLSIFSHAEEGMLIPSLIEAFQSDMKAKGMKLTPDQIYSINHSSLKDAVIHFGGGCTAEIISNQGLILTNHHCGYSQIQQHSSIEKDYLKNGFWAANYNEELANPGLTASRIVSIEDVTKIVLFGTEGLSKLEKLLKIAENIEKITKDKMMNNEYKVDIQDFDYGNSYYCMTSEVFQDVRLVGTPPNSIGKFKCIKFRPVLQKGRIFKDEEDLNVWISDDANRIPIRAQANILVGSVKMDLQDYKGLANPIAKVEK